MPPPAVLVP
jgi:hypothetical protein